MSKWRFQLSAAQSVGTCRSAAQACTGNETRLVKVVLLAKAKQKEKHALRCWLLQYGVAELLARLPSDSYCIVNISDRHVWSETRRLDAAYDAVIELWIPHRVARSAAAFGPLRLHTRTLHVHQATEMSCTQSLTTRCSLVAIWDGLMGASSEDAARHVWEHLHQALQIEYGTVGYTQGGRSAALTRGTFPHAGMAILEFPYLKTEESVYVGERIREVGGKLAGLLGGLHVFSTRQPSSVHRLAIHPPHQIACLKLAQFATRESDMVRH